MSAPAHEWLMQHEATLFTGQRAKADTAKIMAGLTLAVAATMVGTALQVPPVTGLDIAASVSLGFVFLASIAVVGYDHVVPCTREALHHKRLFDLDEYYQAEYILNRLRARAEANDESLTYVYLATVGQVLLAAVTSLLAVLSLVVPS